MFCNVSDQLSTGLVTWFCARPLTMLEVWWLFRFQPCYFGAEIWVCQFHNLGTSTNDAFRLHQAFYAISTRFASPGCTFVVDFGGFKPWNTFCVVKNGGFHFNHFVLLVNCPADSSWESKGPSLPNATPPQEIADLLKGLFSPPFSFHKALFIRALLGGGGVFLLKVQYSILKSLISTCVLSYIGSREDWLLDRICES